MASARSTASNDRSEGSERSAAAAKPELAALHRTLTDTIRRLGEISQELRKHPGAEHYAAELATIETSLGTGDRRLSRLLDRF